MFCPGHAASLAVFLAVSIEAAVVLPGVASIANLSLQTFLAVIAYAL